MTVCSSYKQMTKICRQEMKQTQTRKYAQSNMHCKTILLNLDNKIYFTCKTALTKRATVNGKILNWENVVFKQRKNPFQLKIEKDISSPQSFSIIFSNFRAVIAPMRTRTQFPAILFSKMGTLFCTTAQSSYIEVSGRCEVFLQFAIPKLGYRLGNSDVDNALRDCF